MGQPRIRSGRTWILFLLPLLAISSLGFAIAGLVLGPELNQDLKMQNEAKVALIPGVPDLADCVDFWQERNFQVVSKLKSAELEQGNNSNTPEVWQQGRETWVLVPTEFGADLNSHLWDLVSNFLAEGWSIQIEAEEHGYSLGFWNQVGDYPERVLAHVWHLELLNPKTYNERRRGFVPVLGELFDPWDYQRGSTESPVLALIIDDWGYSTSALEPLLAYPFPLTVAVLPHLPLSSMVGERAFAAGHEVILHQPMEALDSSLDLGPGGITLDMEGEAKVEQLLTNLASLPTAVGLNNHMGSRATEDRETMFTVLQAVKKLDLFFLDSHTSSLSVVPEVAAELDVPYAVNNLFIDNESDVEKIKEQVRKGLTLAERQGHAVIIGHVRPATAQALWELIPEFLASEVDLVPISSLLN